MGGSEEQTVEKDTGIRLRRSDTQDSVQVKSHHFNRHNLVCVLSFCLQGFWKATSMIIFSGRSMFSLPIYIRGWRTSIESASWRGFQLPMYLGQGGGILRCLPQKSLE
jgi:hypothetical protein